MNMDGGLDEIDFVITILSLKLKNENIDFQKLTPSDNPIDDHRILLNAKCYGMTFTG